MLLHRYNNIDYILNMNIDEGIEFITIAYQKEAEEYLHKQWLVNYANMDADNFTSFEDYKKKAFGIKKTNIDNSKLNAKDIISEAEKIRKADQASRKESDK